MFGKKAPPVAALAALVSWAFLAPVSQAAELQPAEVISVKAGDLNLETQAGAKALLARIDAAATQACFPDKLSEMDQFKACKDGVILDAVKVMDRPMVSLVYAETYSTKEAKPLIVASR